MLGFQARQQACEGFFVPLGLSKEYGPSPFRSHTPLQTGSRVPTGVSRLGSGNRLVRSDGSEEMGVQRNLSPAR